VCGGISERKRKASVDVERRDGGDWLRGVLFNMLSRTHDLHSSFTSPRRACKALRIFFFFFLKKGL